MATRKSKSTVPQEGDSIADLEKFIERKKAETKLLSKLIQKINEDHEKNLLSYSQKKTL